MARPRDNWNVTFENVSYTDTQVKIWGKVDGKDRDTVTYLTQEKAVELIELLKKANEGIESRKLERVEDEKKLYLQLRAKYELENGTVTAPNGSSVIA